MGHHRSQHEAKDAMDQDARRQVVNLGTYVVTLIANGAAVALPLNGLTTAEISDRFPALVTPADYVFGIWSLIYLLLGAFSIWQALPRNRADGPLRSVGYLPAVAGVLNALWVVLWHFEVFALTVPVMVSLLVTLILVHRRLRGVRQGSGPSRWLVGLPFSVYLGWITVATIANISQMLMWAGYGGAPIGEVAWSVIVLAIGVGITAAMLLREADWAYALVIIWAYVGIAVGQAELVTTAAAVLGALAVVGLLIVLVLRTPRRGPSAQPA
jgi:hypothetical protein